MKTNFFGGQIRNRKEIRSLNNNPEIINQRFFLAKLGTGKKPDFEKPEKNKSINDFFRPIPESKKKSDL